MAGQLRRVCYYLFVISAFATIGFINIQVTERHIADPAECITASDLMLVQMAAHRRRPISYTAAGNGQDVQRIEHHKHHLLATVSERESATGTVFLQSGKGLLTRISPSFLSSGPFEETARDTMSTDSGRASPSDRRSKGRIIVSKGAPTYLSKWPSQDGVLNIHGVAVSPSMLLTITGCCLMVCFICYHSSLGCLLTRVSQEGERDRCVQDALPHDAPMLPGIISRVTSPSDEDAPCRDAAAKFCPKLVVPEQSTDYTLYVPVRLDADGPFDVVDSDGMRVARIAPRGPSACQSPQAREALTPPSNRHARNVNWWRLLLLDPSDNASVMAQCCALGAHEFHVRCVDGTFFAKLVHDKEAENCYTLAVFDGRRYIYKGDHAKQLYRIEDDAGSLLATAEKNQDGAFYKLQVTASTEVGLALCGILCVEWHVASLYSRRTKKVERLHSDSDQTPIRFWSR